MRPDEAADRLGELQILDVREPKEWAAGRIQGARHIPMAQVPERVDELDPQLPVVTVCRSGARSDEVAGFLRSKGFDAQNMDGGMQAWEQTGLPFSAPDGGPGRVI